MEKLNIEDIKIIIELICNEQTKMIVEDPARYECEKYKMLEELKIKVKDLH